MLLTSDSLPETIRDIAELDDLLCRPSQPLIDDLEKVDGDLMILGVAGKMGPTLAGLAKAALPERRVIGVARFSDPSAKAWLEARGIETISCDLLDEAAVARLPKLRNVVFMAGRKFGAEGDLSLTWAMNAHVPALVAQAFRNSRIVAFSTGCVYPFVPVDGNGADEAVAPNPPGEYAQSCVGRERMFEYFSRRFSTPGRLFRLNYAIDMRYGVLHDIASKIFGAPTDRRQPRPCQLHLAGRRLGAGAALPRLLRHADLADQRQRPRNPRRARSGERARRTARLRANHHGQGGADRLAHRHLASPKDVRFADRRYRAADRLDRGLGRARDAEPGKAHQIRGARWPLLTRPPSSGSARATRVRAWRCRRRRTGTRTRPTGIFS